MWLIFALAAYVLFAAATITDKYLLAKPIPDARVYAFYTGALGLFAFFLAPFGFFIPQDIFILFGILAGVIFLVALFLFFFALQREEVSRVGIALGGLTPLFTLLLVYVGTRSLPDTQELFAFALLVVGSIIILLENFRKLSHHAFVFALVTASSFLFGLYFLIAKFLFENLSFINAFLWIKLGGAFAALFFLFSSDVRKMLFHHKKSLPKTAGGIFIAKNAAGGIAALLQHLAIAAARFGEIALVNALQGVQFALVFLGVVFLTKKFPEVVREKIDREAMIVKAAGTAFIIGGIITLALGSF